MGPAEPPDNGERSGANEARDDEVEAGEPVSILAELEVEPDDQFLERVRSSIGRRNLASNLILQAVYLPFVVLFELLDMMFSIVNSMKDEKGGSKRWKKDST